MLLRMAMLGLVLAVLPLGALCAQDQLQAEASSDSGNLIKLARPAERQFILDEAGLISATDAAEIKKICEKVLTERATPIVVVTIDSMAKHGGAGMRIETFARLLFDQWGVGHAKINGEPWNTGILLLVSKEDRKARIELGAHWRHDQDAQAQQIMDEIIIPHFKQGKFSEGIRMGVKALSDVANGLDMSARTASMEKYRPPRPWWHYALVVGAIGLGIFTVVSMIRNGSSGWAWLFWGAVFAFVGYLLYAFLTSRGSSSSGGGFSGGSFGGGFSGGGGASGSW